MAIYLGNWEGGTNSKPVQIRPMLLLYHIIITIYGNTLTSNLNNKNKQDAYIMNGHLYPSSPLVIIHLRTLDTDFLMVYVLFPFKYSLFRFI